MTIACLENLKKTTIKRNVDFFVFDNGSVSEDSDKVKQFCAINGMKFVKLPGPNVGYCHGMNYISEFIDKTLYDYCFFVTNDVFVTPQTLSKLLAEFKNNDELEICSPIHWHVNSHNELTKDQLFLASAQVNRKTLDTRHKKEPFENNFDYWIEFINGSVFLITTRWLKKNGLFDSRFYTWYEDVDLSLRIQKAGRKIKYSQHAEVYHVGGATNSKEHARAIYYRRSHKAKSFGLLVRLHSPLSLKLKLIIKALFLIITSPISIILILFGVPPKVHRYSPLSLVSKFEENLYKYFNNKIKIKINRNYSEMKSNFKKKIMIILLRFLEPLLFLGKLFLK